ncbi:cytochrome b [Haematobacter genomosp. 1]|uniref:Cytochrome b n=1 Tax=Haematobacter genomosp. 1 TaxID=366618 RepID=A0A212ABH9_9RHOB|nr:cytochrome b [Haematobacter genomosp. 1]OWJ77962.1 cytochrome b [Haematobacter genomosp. 1]
MPSPTVPLRDTPTVYGRVTRVLHWSIAALVLWQLFGMTLRLIFGRQPVVSFFVGSHQPVGTVLFGLILLRVIWAFANRGNRPSHGAGLVGVGARLGHLALYTVMLVVPSVALLRAWGSDRVFAPFGFQVFPARTTPVEWAVGLGDALHGELGWVLALLILGHVVMVGLHEGMWRDGTMARMAGSRARRG